MSADLIPGLSQTKSLVQFVLKDTDGAKRTQRNFFTMVPIVAHVVALLAKMARRQQLARDALVGGNETLVDIVDATPITGHIKGTLQWAVLGNGQCAFWAWVAATRSTVVAAVGCGGYLAGGTFAAAVLAALAGCCWDLAASSVSKKRLREGVLQVVDQPKNWETGLDAIVDVVADMSIGIAGAAFVNILLSTPDDEAIDRTSTMATWTTTSPGPMGYAHHHHRHPSR